MGISSSSTLDYVFFKCWCDLLFVLGQLGIAGRGCLLLAKVLRVKKDLKGESNAKEISDALPFIEYELHRQLLNKLKGQAHDIFSRIFKLRIHDFFLPIIVLIFSSAQNWEKMPFLRNKNFLFFFTWEILVKKIHSFVF